METIAAQSWDRAVAYHLCGQQEFASAQNSFICSLLHGLYSAPGANLLFKRAYQELSAKKEQKDLLSLAQLAARVQAIPGAKIEELLERAAELGDGTAKNRLASAYLRGELGLKREGKKAAFWFEQALQANNCEKIEDLFDIYSEGIDVPKNAKQAHELLLRGEKLGCADALNHLGFKSLVGQSPCKLSYEKAFNFFARAAEKNHSVAQYQLGKLLIEGAGCKQDIAQGLRWIQQSADQNWFDAWIFLGDSNARGIYHPQDTEKAIYWLDKAFAELTLDKHAKNAYSLVKLADKMEQFQPEKSKLLRELAYQRGGPPPWLRTCDLPITETHFCILLALYYLPYGTMLKVIDAASPMIL